MGACASSAPWIHQSGIKAVADPGFPVGGGGANLRCVHFLVKTYVKTKEIDPVGGGGACAGSTPGSTNARAHLKALEALGVWHNATLK